jgi:hypothetical protein
VKNGHAYKKEYQKTLCVCEAAQHDTRRPSVTTGMESNTRRTVAKEAEKEDRL